jgi:hypothetical protein
LNQYRANPAIVSYLEQASMRREAEIVSANVKSEKFDEFVKDRDVRRELGGLTEITLYRWDRGITEAPEGWEPPILIGRSHYRRRSMVETVKANLVKAAAKRHHVAA